VKAYSKLGNRLSGLLACVIRGVWASNKIEKQATFEPAQKWASLGMPITFRAEVMPGRFRHERTFLVAQFLSSGRVLLEGLVGEHTRTEFEKPEQLMPVAVSTRFRSTFPAAAEMFC